MASALSSCHLEATLTNLHQTFRSKHSSLEYCSILFLCPHLAETFLTLRVTYLCLFPRSLFLLIVLATQLVPYCQAVVPPLAKGLHFKDRLCHQKLCSSYCSHTGSVGLCSRKTEGLWIQQENISQLLC